jgi:hypothetical protein
MKRTIHITASALALAAGLLLPACTQGEPAAQEGGTAPQAEQPKAEVPLPASLIQTKAEIAQARAQVDMALAKLQILAGTTGDDLEDPYDAYVESIETLESAAEGLKGRGDTMRDKGAAYFQEWEEQLAKMTTAAVKDVATKRKDELEKAYSDVLTKMQETRAAYDTYHDTLEAVHTRLDDELDEDALKAIAPQVKAAKTQAETLKQRADAVLASIDAVAGVYTRK